MRKIVKNGTKKLWKRVSRRRKVGVNYRGKEFYRTGKKAQRNKLFVSMLPLLRLTRQLSPGCSMNILYVHVLIPSYEADVSGPAAADVTRTCCGWLPAPFIARRMCNVRANVAN